MEAAEQQTTAAPPAPDYEDAPKDIANVAKGKRTKRQRPQSPIRFTLSSSNNNDIMHSPVSSSGFPAGSITTEEEETAESLILLSRGQSLDMTDIWTSRKNKDDYDGMFKFNSKKYIQSSATGEGGVFVYECKTCGRTFPSFQALGGHRASHKKPKNNEDIRKPPPYMEAMYNNERPPPPLEFTPSLSFQLNNRVSLIGNTMKSSSRLHECSICGTEFNSGQALGGHMRRHRVPNGRNKGGNSNGVTNNIDATALSLIPFSPVTMVEMYDQKSQNDALCVGLDLNLPAPLETAAAAASDNQSQNRSFAFLPAGENENEHQPAVHLAGASTLVGCHY